MEAALNHHVICKTLHEIQSTFVLQFAHRVLFRFYIILEINRQYCPNVISHSAICNEETMCIVLSDKLIYRCYICKWISLFKWTDFILCTIYIVRFTTIQSATKSRFKPFQMRYRITNINNPFNKDRPTWCHLLYFFIFIAQHVSNVSTSIFRSLRLIVDLFHVLYCSGSMCVGVTVWFG